MDIYNVICAFDIPMLGVEVGIGDTVSKLGSSFDCLVNAIAWDDKAFYQWVGSKDSLNYLELS